MLEVFVKLIVWGEDRARCIERTKRALWEFQIGGVRNNIPFHEVVMDHPEFKAGNYDTSFIPKYNILEAVVKYVEEMKKNSGVGAQVAAIAAATAVSQATQMQKN